MGQYKLTDICILTFVTYSNSTMYSGRISSLSNRYHSHCRALHSQLCIESPPPENSNQHLKSTDVQNNVKIITITEKYINMKQKVNTEANVCAWKPSTSNRPGNLIKSMN